MYRYLSCDTVAHYMVGEAGKFMMGICGAVLIAGGLLASWDIAFSSFGARFTLLGVGIATMVLPMLSYMAFNHQQTLFLLIMVIYCLLRISLIALVFYSFHSLPLDVYASPSLNGLRIFLLY